VSAVEAAVLSDRVGEDFEAVVVDGTGKGVVVQLTDPPVSEEARGTAELGSVVSVRVEAADVLEGSVDLRVLG
jgi:exoribonuclease R